MPRAYLDLGATYDAPPSAREPSGTVGVISMAGYLADPGSWISFNRKWRRLLRDNDVPDMIFHMNKFETRQGLYNGWSNAHRDSFIKKLLTILTDHVTLGVAGGVVTVDYYSFSEEDREILGSPYRLCASSVMGDLARWLQKNGVEEKVSYVFELGDEGQGIFRLALNELLHRRSIREKFRIESADFRTKAEATGLQTGDIAAYEVCKHIPRVMGTVPRPTRKSMSHLLSRVPHIGKFFSRPELEHMLAVQKGR